VRLTPVAIEDRKAVLTTLVSAVGNPHLQFSGDFDDPFKLLETCDRMNLEGIVSKRKGSAYRSGPTKEWPKIKTPTWRAANKHRWELFQK
jgi:ATP-dependent DNA ligase